jgi:hypothetical protein
MNIDAAIYEREQARIAKDWKRSDELREALADRGVFVVDTKDGQEVTHTPGWSRERWAKQVEQDRRANAAFDAWLYTMSR